MGRTQWRPGPGRVDAVNEEIKAPESGERVKSFADTFSLDRADIRRLISVMRVRVRSVGVGDHVDEMDIVQDAFLSAMRKRISDNLHFDDKNRFFAWMCRLAENEARPNAQSRQRRDFRWLVPDEVIEEVADTRDVSHIIDEQPSLRHAYAQLKPPQRFAVEAHVLEGKTFREIAEETGVPHTTIQSRVEAALETMRVQVESLDAHSPRRRKAVALVPFFLLGLIARSARATIGAACAWLLAQLRQSPKRLLVGAGSFAAVLATTPSGNTHDDGGPFRAQAVATIVEPSALTAPGYHGTGGEQAPSVVPEKGQNSVLPSGTAGTISRDILPFNRSVSTNKAIRGELRPTTGTRK